MDDLPPRLSAGQTLSAAWLNRLLAWLRSRDLRAGPGARLARTPSGTTISVPAAKAPAKKPPMPFDCRLGVAGEGASAATHLFVYVPEAGENLVKLSGGNNGSYLTPLGADAGAISHDWLDAGEISAGDAVWLQVVVSTEDWASHKEAAVSMDYSRCWHVSVGSYPAAPTGYVQAGPLAKPVLLARWTADGLRQRNHGFIRYDWQQPDDEVQDGTGWNQYTPRTLSVDGNYCAKLSLHGFRSPTTISNPYKSGGTAPSSPDNVLVLVRVLSSDGKTAELKYVRLADLAASSSGDGGADDPEGYDTLRDLEELPCPVGHDRTAPLVIYWNPCDLEDAQGSVLQPAGWQQGQFWPTGGDERTCNGSYVGDSSGKKAIYLDGHRLTGPNGNNAWAADGDFTVDGDIITPNTVHTRTIDATSSVQCGGTITATGNIGTPADISCGGTLTIGTGANAIDVGATLSGLDTLLSQI